MRVVCLQHVPFEGPGWVEQWCAGRGHELLVHPVYSNGAESHPQADLLVVLGGPMGVGDADAYPWLLTEIEVLKRRVTEGVPTLGICLGAQVIASALGATVRPARCREIGWFRASTVNDAFGWPGSFTPFHWHGETFDLPAGARQVARTEMCEHQGFTYGEKVVALQFHLEATEDTVRALIANCADELEDQPFCMRVSQMLERTDELAPQGHAMLESMLDQMCKA